LKSDLIPFLFGIKADKANKSKVKGKWGCVERFYEMEFITLDGCFRMAKTENFGVIARRLMPLS